MASKHLTRWYPVISMACSLPSDERWMRSRWKGYPAINFAIFRSSALQEIFFCIHMIHGYVKSATLVRLLSRPVDNQSKAIFNFWSHPGVMCDPFSSLVMFQWFEPTVWPLGNGLGTLWLKQDVPISTMLWIFWKTRLAIFFQLLLWIRLPVCPCRARSWAWLCAVLGRHSWEIVGCKLVPVFLCAS